ncbi:MAG: phosphate signaling complex PhoU family protein [Methylococcaceae bacterium]|nr:phosphate uptake regulator PhoU [Prolixibacteraceae bacterium]
MSNKKDEAIREILSDYEHLANMVLQQLDALERIIDSGIPEINEEDYSLLKKTESKINKIEVKLSEDIVNSIVLYQPVASEIRKLVACYRIVISLERIGDLVLSITKLMRKIEARDVYESLSEFISRMMVLSADMARKSMLAFINQDMELAMWTIRNEAIVDEFNRKMLKKVAERAYSMAEDKNLVVSFINIKEMVSSIERIADHAANIAEASYYSTKGKDIRHKRAEKHKNHPKQQHNGEDQ